jgi:hypothetical protein
MAEDTRGLYCVTCGKQTLHRRMGGVNHVLHAILTIFTCFLWGIVWVILAISANQGGLAAYLCATCGTSFDGPRAEAHYLAHHPAPPKPPEG